MEKVIPAFGYLRVSGKSQVDGDGFARQRLSIEKYSGFNRVDIVRWFEEKAVSGATEWDNRPAWAEMISALNGVRTIVIERLDRLARDLMVQEHIIADLKKRGIELISAAEPDLGSEEPTRILMRQIMGAVAQYDKAMIVQKLRGARERKRARGERCEGQVPFGEKPGEERLVVLIENLYRTGRSGMSTQEIADSLNRNGYKARGGGKWFRSGVARVLKRAYAAARH